MKGVVHSNRLCSKQIIKCREENLTQERIFGVAFGTQSELKYVENTQIYWVLLVEALRVWAQRHCPYWSHENICGSPNFSEQEEAQIYQKDYSNSILESGQQVYGKGKIPVKEKPRATENNELEPHQGSRTKHDLGISYTHWQWVDLQHLPVTSVCPPHSSLWGWVNLLHTYSAFHSYMLHVKG